MTWISCSLLSTIYNENTYSLSISISHLYPFTTFIGILPFLNCSSFYSDLAVFCSNLSVTLTTFSSEAISLSWILYLFFHILTLFPWIPHYFLCILPFLLNFPTINISLLRELLQFSYYTLVILIAFVTDEGWIPLGPLSVSNHCAWNIVGGVLEVFFSENTQTTSVNQTLCLEVFLLRITRTNSVDQTEFFSPSFIVIWLDLRDLLPLLLSVTCDVPC